MQTVPVLWTGQVGYAVSCSFGIFLAVVSFMFQVKYLGW